MYTDNSELGEENVLSSLYAASILERLVKLCTAFLENHIDAKNVCENARAVFYQVKILEKNWFDYILENAS